ncbi:patatin-like phospholipase family protein [Sphingobacterium hungaricum]|uniref:Patatin n=1 Tax=Sphingobacterium hungaricum TaxID=2082723 RepID=A0A928UUM9_9SPHI|nr:patatin-like phospholipase family protein [Sphingobacterium hungaricum]MBE8712173.1 patatin [Sphingobacterium hungaricum]
MEINKKVSLVLGSGGARGITQIGIINLLHERGYEIDEIVGCSIGSLVGAAFAQGKVGDLGEWMSRLTKRQVFKLMDFTDPRFGFLKGERALNSLKEVFEDKNIEDLTIKYTAIATDLLHEREEIFDKGSVYQAIRASIAIPAVFTGIQLADKFLVDGGVLNPIPVNYVTKKDNLIVAVNLDGAPLLTEHKSFHRLNTFALIQESYYAMRRKLSAMSLELYKPDYVIHVPHNISGIWDFDRSKDLIDQGFELANQVIPEHEKSLRIG